MIFYLDASIQKAVRTGIAGVRDDVMYAGGPNAPDESTRDEVWLPIAGDEDWVVIMRDKHIRTRPGESQALRDAGVRAFCLTHAGNSTRWEVLQLLATRWRRIEAVAGSVAGPYIYGVTRSAVSRLNI